MCRSFLESIWCKNEKELFQLALACDFIYATKKSKFGQPEVKIGMIPGFGGCVRLMRLLGPAKSKELIYSGQSLLANEALKLGLVNQLFDTNEQLMDGAKKTLLEIAKCSPYGVALAKSVLTRMSGLTVKEGLQMEKAAYATVFEHKEKHEGIQAFFEKRAPVF